MCSFVCMNINECFVHASHCFAVASDVFSLSLCLFLRSSNVCRRFFLRSFSNSHFFLNLYCSEWVIRLPFSEKWPRKYFVSFQCFDGGRRTSIFILTHYCFRNFNWLSCKRFLEIDTYESLWLGLGDNSTLKVSLGCGHSLVLCAYEQ